MGRQLSGDELLPSGTWTTYRGERRQVSGRVDLDTITLQEGRPPDSRRERVPISQVDDVVEVVTRASWRGGVIILGDFRGSEVGFHSDDADLARRESLYGDQYSGWTGLAQVEELSDIRQDRTVLRRAGTEER